MDEGGATIPEHPVVLNPRISVSDMKTRSAPAEPPNIAASVKARRSARTSFTQALASDCAVPTTGVLNQVEMVVAPIALSCSALPSAGANSEEKALEEATQRNRQVHGSKLLKGTWTADDRRLFFQAVRLYGKNFNEITRFIRARGHLSGSQATNNEVTGGLQSNHASLSERAVASSSSATVGAGILMGGIFAGPTVATGSQDLTVAASGRTREQVRLLYQQTWNKLRRYIKYPDGVPQHVREIYAIVNWSIMRSRIKKPLDNRLGEKLNELVHFGSTTVKHKSRRFLLRTPICPALKHLNNISAPAQEVTLPEDVWLELVPSSQIAAWRVLEGEQNPRLRLKVDINRQLSDVISLVEAKWILPAERIRSLLRPAQVRAFNARQPTEESVPSISEHLCLRLSPEQHIDGAISLREVTKTRSGHISMTAYLKRHPPTVKPCPDASPPLNSLGQDAIPPPPSTDSLTEAAKGSTNCDVFKTLSDEKVSIPHEIQSNPLGVTPSIPNNSSNPAAHLDLRAIGRTLADGITFEDARSVKIVVIYLALGCPEKVRFEYDFVWPTVSYSSNRQKGSQWLSLSKDLHGDAFTNGLRRLLHLNASDYLSFRDWTRRRSRMRSRLNQSTNDHVQFTTETPKKPMPAIVSYHSGESMDSADGEDDLNMFDAESCMRYSGGEYVRRGRRPANAQPVFTKRAPSTLPQPAPMSTVMGMPLTSAPGAEASYAPDASSGQESLSHWPGHEALVVGQPVSKVFVARKLNVHGPKVGISASGTSACHPKGGQLTFQVLPTSVMSHSEQAIQPRLNPTQIFITNDHLPGKVAKVSYSGISSVPQILPKTGSGEEIQSSLGAVQAFSRTQALSVRQSFNRRRSKHITHMDSAALRIPRPILPSTSAHLSDSTQVMVLPSAVTPTLTNDFHDATSIQNKTELQNSNQFGTAYMFDGQSNQSSTSDTMKSLMNVIMRTGQPSSEAYCQLSHDGFTQLPSTVHLTNYPSSTAEEVLCEQPPSLADSVSIRSLRGPDLEATTTPNILHGRVDDDGVVQQEKNFQIVGRVCTTDGPMLQQQRSARQRVRMEIQDSFDEEIPASMADDGLVYLSFDSINSNNPSSFGVRAHEEEEEEMKAASGSRKPSSSLQYSGEEECSRLFAIRGPGLATDTKRDAAKEAALSTDCPFALWNDNFSV